jgi:hypothetical protein
LQINGRKKGEKGKEKKRKPFPSQPSLPTPSFPESETHHFQKINLHIDIITLFENLNNRKEPL